MKTLIKSSLIAFAAIAATSVSYADAVRPQSANQPAAQRSVAILVSGHEAGSVQSPLGALQTVSHDNGHGQSIVLYVR